MFLSKRRITFDIVKRLIKAAGNEMEKKLHSIITSEKKGSDT